MGEQADKPGPRSSSPRPELEALRIDRSPEPGGRGKGFWLALLAIVVAAAAAAAWFGLRGERAVAVRTVTVREQSAGQRATVLNASGYVSARRRATVSAQITGRLTEVRVEEGLPVQQGQVLAVLDDTQYVARLDLSRSRLVASQRAAAETEARLELARITLRRTERLVQERVADEAALDAARIEVRALEARLALEREQISVADSEVALRQAELDETVVRAPFDGVVISKDAQPGEMISPMSAGGSFTRTGICTIVDMGSLEIEVDVNESYISRVRPDQGVEALLDAYPDWPIPGHVITTVPAADRQRATVLVRIAFEELDSRILPDMGVKVAFQEREAEDAGAERSGPRIVVPASALRQEEGREIVFVVSQGRVERRAVSLGGRSGDDVEIASGIAGGEEIVVEVPADLADGDRVTVR